MEQDLGVMVQQQVFQQLLQHTLEVVVVELLIIKHP